MFSNSKLYLFLTIFYLGILGCASEELTSARLYIQQENWEKAENAILSAVKDKGLNYIVETGEAAFYGPKLDFLVKDALGREWQLGTIQEDYNLPERFF